MKVLKLLKVIRNTEWGADRKVMLCLYRSLVRSKLYYWCIVYGSYLQMLKHVHNQGIRLCLGAFRTSPVRWCTRTLFGWEMCKAISAVCFQDKVSDILETPWRIRSPKIVLDLVHLKKGHRDESVYQQLFMEIRNRYRDYRWFTGWELYVACAPIFPSDTVIKWDC